MWPTTDHILPLHNLAQFVLDWRRSQRTGCGRRFNQRGGSVFNDLQFPADVVLLAVLWRLRYVR